MDEDTEVEEGVAPAEETVVEEVAAPAEAVEEGVVSDDQEAAA